MTEGRRSRGTKGRRCGRVRGSRTSDLAVEDAALVAEAALPLAQLLLRRRPRLEHVLHLLHRRRRPGDRSEANPQSVPRRSFTRAYSRRRDGGGESDDEEL